MEGKVWYLSRTIWVNLILGILASVSVAWPHATFLQGWINDHMAIFSMGWSLAAMALRMITKDKIVLSD